jgi:hypothetical protein
MDGRKKSLIFAALSDMRDNSPIGKLVLDSLPQSESQMSATHFLTAVHFPGVLSPLMFLVMVPLSFPASILPL